MTSAQNGKEALDLYIGTLNRRDDETEMLDGIFMDLNVPVMNGFEATEKIRNYEQKTGIRPIPIVAMTASYDDNWEAKGKKVGLDGFVTKPINLKQIEEVIKRFIYIDKK
ncbi:MAG: response regulator [Proteobacteria bacterium]|nr:response regulator [Pseudomonadota bacterium]